VSLASGAAERDEDQSRAAIARICGVKLVKEFGFPWN
jgi:hypothetical protein